MSTATKTRNSQTTKTTATKTTTAAAAGTAEDTVATTGGQGGQNARGWVAEGLAGMAVQARRDAVSTVWRCRRQVLPHAVAAAVLGAGLGAQAVVAEGAQPAGVATVVAMTCYPAALWTARRARRRHPVWAKRVTIGGLGAATWLTITAVCGVGEAGTAILLGAETALAARWWQANRIGYPALTGDGDPVTGGEQAAPLTDLAAIMADFEANASCPGGPLPGAKLSLPEKTRYGWAFTLQLKRGRQTWLKSVLPKLDDLAGALGVGVEAIIVEAHPAINTPSVCRLQVITDSPIAGSVVFDGPRRHITDGSVLAELGPYADGDGEALYRIYTPGSMWSGFVLGGTGTGKSRVIENIVISAMAGGDTEYWFLDPQGGASSSALREHADWFITMAGARQALAAATQILVARSEENSVEGWSGFTPSPGRPGILIVIDECHNVFADEESVDGWAKIAREGRKAGIAILCVSQYPGLTTFGNSEPLRSSIMTGNALALWVNSNSAGQMMAGLDVDPKTLPRIPGYAYLQGNPDSGIRTAPFRNRNTDPDMKGTLSRHWLAQVTGERPGLDTLSVTATKVAGRAYLDRHTSTETTTAASADRIARLRAGHLPAQATPGAHPTAKTGTARSYGDAKVVAFPMWTPDFGQQDSAATGTAAAAAATATLPRRVVGLTDSHQAVLDAIAAGVDRPSDIEEAVSLSHRQVQTLLADLLAASYITKPKYGRYQAVA